MSLQLSNRANALGTENAFVVLAEVNALARTGKDIISFCIGQPDFPAPMHVQEAGIDAIRTGKHGYTPSAGIDPLREAAAKYMGEMRGITIDAEDVVVGSGAKPFIAYAILSVTDFGAGDEVIYPVPGFPIYESQILTHGAKPVPLYLREDRNFAFDPKELEAKITPKTKMLILNSPQNPTGGILGKKDLEAIAAILRKHPHIWIYARRHLQLDCLAARYASAHHHQRRLQQNLGDDGLAHRLHRQQSARALVHQMGNQHR
jgi:aspartate aminotransferase